MNEQDRFELILASLHGAMLDGALWPRTSALIDEACGTKGNAVLLGEGPREDVRAHMVGLYYRGERREDLEREYLEVYHSTDEFVPRFRRQPYGRLVGRADLCTEDELKTSVTFNEFHHRASSQRGLFTRLEGPEGYSHLTWSIGDPAGRDGGWSSGQLAMVKRIMPHVRQLFWVRQALADAGVLGTSVTELLGAQRLGVVHLDRWKRIIAANDLAREVLRRGDSLSDRGGVLSASAPADRVGLDQLLANAVPQFGSIAVGGSMSLSRRSGRQRLMVHVKPTVVRELDLVIRRVAAVVLIVDPWRSPRIDPGNVATAFGLTPAESEVACWLAQGKNVAEIAASTGRQKRTVYWLLEQIYAKLGVRRQVDLVRLVLAATGFPAEPPGTRRSAAD